MWTQPIFDRTEEDLNNPKGQCRAGDLQRLEDNCAVLGEMMSVKVETKSWTRQDIPTDDDMSRIRQNIVNLRASYYTYPYTPANPDNPLNHWEKWNSAEQILNDIYELYNINLPTLMYTGECWAGDQIGVI